MRARAFALLLVACALPAFAAQDPRPDFSLRGAADAAASRREAAFGGSIHITTDADWRRQWADARGAMPQFTEASSIARGTRVWVLVFFSNAHSDRGGEINVTCDLRFLRPDGTAAYEGKDLSCYKGRVEGPTGNLRLATQQIEFVGDKNDAPGTWRVEVKLRDTNGRSEVPLIGVFTLRG